jgi:hypothetical protein
MFRGEIMITEADYLVRSSEDRIQLLVEVKTKIPASREWASRMRRNLFTHVPLPRAKFFLLALPERFYLWKDAAPEAAVPPDYEVDAKEVLKPYLEKLQTPLLQLSPSSFELLVGSWLEDLVHADLDGARLAPSQKWLIDSGLYDAIRHGSIER